MKVKMAVQGFSWLCDKIRWDDLKYRAYHRYMKGDG
jgi:hypothetical protein